MRRGKHNLRANKAVKWAIRRGFKLEAGWWIPPTPIHKNAKEDMAKGALTLPQPIRHHSNLKRGVQ